jgi:isopenicillin N synthase-like dioxygenase
LLTKALDYGSLTLLFQDSVGGLQVQNPTTNEFTAAPPIVSNGLFFQSSKPDQLRTSLEQL